MPNDRKVYDPLDDMVAWESGTLDDDGILRLFQHLVDSGMAWTLQGMYGRTAQALIDSGLIKQKPNQE